MIKQILFLFFTISSIKSYTQSSIPNKNGDFKSYYDNGKIKESGFYSNGKGQGEWKSFYESGQLKIVCYVKDDKREGNWISYYENGKVFEIGSYKNNKRNGEWKVYYDNGNLNGVAILKNGDLDIFIDGYQAKKYYDNGNLEWTYPQNGTGQSNSFFKNGKLKSTGYLKNDKKYGEWKEYYDNGKLKEIKVYDYEDSIKNKFQKTDSVFKTN